MRDLFGEPITEPSKEPKKRKDPERKGHVDPKGTGPDGETCKSCRHVVGVVFAKTYWKCGLARNIWTHGRGTDVGLRDAACRSWKARGPE